MDDYQVIQGIAKFPPSDKPIASIRMRPGKATATYEDGSTVTVPLTP